MVRRRDPCAGRAAVAAGLLLIAWIVVEIMFIRDISFLQPFFAGVGVAFIVIGRRSLHQST